MAGEEVKAIARDVVGLFQSGAIGDVDRLFAPEYVSVTHAWIGDDRTRAGVKGDVAALRCAFPDLACTIDDVIAQGDRVYLRWRFTGTHRGPLLGVAPTGARVTHKWQDVFRLRGGRIVERSGHEDRLELLGKLTTWGDSDGRID